MDSAESMVYVFARAIARRADLPDELTLLAGEPQTVSYDRLQQRIGALIHGENDWRTLEMPRGLSKAGAWLQEKSEPLVPDDFDQGEKPFIRPFMVDMASHHYALDITRVNKWLGWQPRHHIEASLPRIIATLKDDPPGWYKKHAMTPPYWMQTAVEKEQDPERLRVEYLAWYERTHRQSLWAFLLNTGLGFWLLTSPFILGYQSRAMTWSDVICGALVVVLGLLSLSSRSRFQLSRWGLGLIGMWLLFAPLVFWAPTEAAYLNDTLVGALVMGFALLTRPAPGILPTAAMTGPDIPPGWDFSPSAWSQRLPIIVLAFIGFFISRYMAAYQLGHIDGVWERIGSINSLFKPADHSRKEEVPCFPV